MSRIKQLFNELIIRIRQLLTIDFNEERDTIVIRIEDDEIILHHLRLCEIYCNGTVVDYFEKIIRTLTVKNIFREVMNFDYICDESWLLKKLKELLTKKYNAEFAIFHQLPFEEILLIPKNTKYYIIDTNILLLFE